MKTPGNLPLRLGIAGLGTVGGGVVRLVPQQRDLVAARCGRPIQVAAVSAPDPNRYRCLALSSLTWYADPVAIAGNDEIEDTVEMIGGHAGPPHGSHAPRLG